MVRLEYEAGSYYEGEVNSANARHGEGKMTYGDGNWYEGTWRNDKQQGNGTSFMFGETYKGGFVDGKKHGRGTLSNSLRSYTGQWRWGKKHGQGHQKSPEGIYEGSFKKGCKDGKGKFTGECNTGECNTYEGDYVGGLKSGQGIMMTKAADEERVYEGSFVKNMRHGTGTLAIRNTTARTSSRYTGDWQDGARYGTGTCEYFKEGDIDMEYSGGWKKDEWDGEGELRTSKLWYRGGFANRLKAGYGEIEYFEDEITYKGYWKDGKYEGQGTLVYSDCVSEGTFVAGDLNGTAVIKWKNGNQYTGDMVKGKKCGRGKFVTQDWEYDGEFESGKQHGEGTCFYKNEGGTYTGMWAYGMQNGIGERRNGDTVRKGTFRAGKLHGKGSFKDPTSSYDGDWVQGFRQGEGVLILQNMTYKGEFKNGKPHGTGRSTFTTGDEYEGQFVDGKYEGQGCLTTVSNDKTTYVGNFKLGHYNGAGVLTKWTEDDTTKCVHDGQWLNGKRHGEGLFTSYEDDVVVRGVWENNQLVEKDEQTGGKDRGTLTMHGGDYVEVTYHNGRIETGTRDENGKWYGLCEFRYDNGTHYKGMMKEGKRCGYGYHAVVGKVYNGNFENGTYNGHGVEECTEGVNKGTKKTGNWKDGKLHGIGEEWKPEGSHFKGEWVEGKRHGLGQLTFTSNGKLSERVGMWDNGEFTRGTITKNKGGDDEQKLEGSFVNCKLEGEGTATTMLSIFKGLFVAGDRTKGHLTAYTSTFEEKYTYEGSFKDGTMHGEGVRQMANGDVHKGTFENGELHEGVKKTRGSEYQGHFVKGKPEGQGKYIIDEACYTGTWVGGDIVEGTIEYSYGATYTGQIKGLKKHGQGRFESLTHVYEGGWVLGKNDGFGSFEHKTKEIWYKGEYKGGRKNGKGELRSRNKVYKGTFLEDDVHGDHVVEEDLSSLTTYKGGFLHGKRHGLAVLETETSTSTLTYVDGEQHGDITKVQNGGKSTFYATYVNNKLEGDARWEYKHSEGVQVRRGSYKANVWTPVEE